MPDEKANPQLIKLDPFELEAAIKEIKDNFGRSKLVEQQGANSVLRHLVLPKHSYYFVYSDDVDYFVRYKKVDIGREHEPVRQVLVWRNRKANNPYTAGIAKDVFWKHLYKESDLISDSLQSDDGRAFWEYAIAHALETKQWVELINTADGSATTIASKDEFQRLMPSAWGTSQFFQRYIFLIAKPNGESHENN